SLAPSARFALTCKIVAALRRDQAIVSLARKRFRNKLFAQSVSVRIGCIEQRNAEVERLVHEGNRFALREISPPPGGNRPQTETNFAHCEVSVVVSPELHSAECNHRGRRGHGGRTKIYLRVLRVLCG